MEVIFDAEAAPAAALPGRCPPTPRQAPHPMKVVKQVGEVAWSAPIPWWGPSPRSTLELHHLPACQEICPAEIESEQFLEMRAASLMVGDFGGRGSPRSQKRGCVSESLRPGLRQRGLGRGSPWPGFRTAERGGHPYFAAASLLRQANREWPRFVKICASAASLGILGKGRNMLREPVRRSATRTSISWWPRENIEMMKAAGQKVVITENTAFIPSQ